MKKTFKTWHFVIFVIVMALPLLIYSINIHSTSKNYFAFVTTLLMAISIKLIFKIKPFVFVLLSLPMLVFSVIYTIQVFEYNTYVNISTWATLSDSYGSEMQEFIVSLKKGTIGLILFQVGTYIVYLFITYNKVSVDYLNNKIKYVIIALLLFFIIDFSGNGATANAFPLRSMHTLFNYFETKRIERKYLSVKSKVRFNATRLPEFEQNGKETIVIVVGEALRKDHLEYYGYNRSTTPLMKKEDLIVFKDVVSAANQTINSLKRVFTMAEFLNEEDYWKNPSFIKAFSEVGFKTYWITNQPVYGKHESEASFIAQESDEFISSNITNKNKPHYDNWLLKPYESIVNNSIKKKVIFLHILGTHNSYGRRYPKEFNIFAKTINKNNKINLIRQYDNAVRYNDSFLYDVLSLLKKQDGEKSFIMFSDHGESLFDTPSTCYHGSAEPSVSEVDIPLVLWFSNEFRNKHKTIVSQVVDNKNLPVLSSDFFHAFPALFGINFDQQKLDNNFFGKEYLPKFNRKIINVNLELKDYKKLKRNRAKIDY